MGTSVGGAGKLDPGAWGRVQADLPPLDHGPIDLRAGFGFDGDASRPIELEIGSGKGTFLVQQAPLTPGTDYLGIEIAKAYWRHAADRARRHGLANVRLLYGDAGVFVRNYVADATLRQIHVYFPDPWPKARHHKRRLIQASFLRELHRVLELPLKKVSDTFSGTGIKKVSDTFSGTFSGTPKEVSGTSSGGTVRLATDHADYFAWMEDHAARVADLFDRLPFESPEAAGEGELVGTNFERKYRREGRPLFGMILRKRG